MSADPMEHPAGDDATGLTRAELLRRATGGAVVLSAGGLLAACGSSGSSSSASTASNSAATGAAKAGGHLRIGATGGGSKDSIDAHSATADTDIVRISALFEPLAQPTADFKGIEMVLAESIEPMSGDAGTWDIRLRQGVQFHNGKTLSADDVIFSLRRITDPKNPLTGSASIGYINRNGIKKLDARTVRVPLTIKNSAFPADVGQYFNGIVPVGYDPKNPVSTAAWKYQSFTPGQQSVFVKNPNYWQSGKPLADQLTIIDFPDDTARINALLSGQIDLADTVPTAQITQIQGNSSLTLINNPSGVWLPITMRVDQPPFNDVRVRQAFRLMVNRPQMVAQVLSGHGSVANDLYGRFDPAFDSSLPQRQQDIEQAKSLLKQAGQSSLKVTLVTAPVYSGIPEEAQAFAAMTSAAGVTVNLNKTDSGTFYDPTHYLKWTFAQDFWGPRRYLSQVAQGSLPNSPFNETHWADPEFLKLVAQARAELDATKRTELIHAAQKIEYDRGGHIIAFFPNFIGAATSKLRGVPAGVQATFLLGPALKGVGFS
jgi:peptide/nickel transport system substrate-binding protein